MGAMKGRSRLKSLWAGAVAVLCLLGLLFLVSAWRVFSVYNTLSKTPPRVSSTFGADPVEEIAPTPALYLDLLKVVLTRYGLQDRYAPLLYEESRIGKLVSPIFKRGPLPLYWRLPYNPDPPKTGPTGPGMPRPWLV